MKDTAFYTKKTLALGGNLIDLTTPKIMGILNITTDSFYDGGKFLTEKSIAGQAERLIQEGADILDLGACSSRPGAVEIDEETEKKRVLQGLNIIQKTGVNIPVSIDTYRSSIAEIALENGAFMINDISGGSMDEAMLPTVARYHVPFTLMHMVGTPQNMMHHTTYNEVLMESLDYFAKKLEKFTQLGIKDVIIDVGFGFSKTTEQNYFLMDNLPYFRMLNQPILVGISRKSMIYKTLQTTPEDALNGTTVLNTVACLKNADILRVHDVAKAKEVITLINHLRQ
ncbi:MAG: dihydropteroate synthase [Cyclobacteriaceae bacterium]|nr:dihydropteroate synthase [Cyclobacteriaceae bacterium]